jgi:hypothetical protein
MKNKIYYLGWIGSLITITGGIFEIKHWPFAGIFLTLGLTFLAFVFFPMALISNYNGLGRKKPFLYLAIALTIFLNIVGALFKIQHWPGASLLMIAGILSPLVLFLPVYLYYHIKSDEQSLNNFFSILFLLVFLSVMNALLTVRLGKDMVDMPVDIMNTIDLNDYYTVKKNACYQQLIDDKPNSNLVKAKDIKSKSEDLNQLINTIKKEIILRANGDKKDNNQDYISIKMKDNSNIPSFVLLNDNNMGVKLHKGIEEFEKSLLSQLNSNKSKYISQLLKIDKPHKGQTWEENEFNNSPVVYALYRLNTLQDNISLAEIEVLNTMCKAIKK